MITVSCPQCGLNLLLPDSLQGRTVTCSGCKRGIDTSAAEAVPETPMPPPEPPRRSPPPRPPSWADERDRERERNREQDEEPARDPDTSTTRGFLILSGILGCVLGIAVMILNVIQMQSIPQGVNSDQVFLAGMVLGTLLVLFSFIVPAAFQFVAAAALARFRGWGLLVTAAVLSLLFGMVQSFCCGGGVLLVLSGLPGEDRDALHSLRVVAALGQLALGILNLAVGVLLLTTMHSFAVVHAYRVHNPRYRKYLYEDEPDARRRWRD